MRGHVRQRGKSWCVVYDEGVSEDGKRRQRWRGGFATKREAQAELTRLLGTIGDGSYVQPSKLTVREFLVDEWLPAIEGTVRPSTFSQYRTMVRSRIVPAIGSRRLQGVTGAHLATLYRELGTASDEQMALAPASIRLVNAVLSRAFGDAVKWGRLVRAPKASPPEEEESTAQAWTAKELGRFLEHVADDPHFPIWRLGATTGMRRGELLGLTWQWLDLEQGSLRVEQQLLPSLAFGPPKSKRGRRAVALDAETVETLRAHRDAQLLERAFAGDAYVDRDLVFADPLGQPIKPNWVTWRSKKLVQAARLPGSLHTLRHTHTTQMLLNGVPVHVVAARLGDTPATILKTYAHLLPTSDAEAAEQVAALIGRS